MSNTDYPMLEILLAVLFSIGFTICLVATCAYRYGSKSSNDTVETPPPMQIIEVQAVDNDGRNTYARMDSRPLDDVPLAVVVVEPSAPPLETHSSTTAT